MRAGEQAGRQTDTQTRIQTGRQIVICNHSSHSRKHDAVIITTQWRNAQFDNRVVISSGKCFAAHICRHLSMLLVITRFETAIYLVFTQFRDQPRRCNNNIRVGFHAADCRKKPLKCRDCHSGRFFKVAT